MIYSIIIGIFAVIVLALGVFLVYRAYTRHIINKKKAARNQEKHMHNVEVAKSKLGITETDCPVGDQEQYKHLRGRFNALGVFVAAAFSVLAAKLFSIQVVNSQRFKDQAKANATTTVSTPAPRGFILDADGMVLVKNKSSMTVLAEADVVDNPSTIKVLSSILGLPFNVVKNRAMNQTVDSTSKRVIASDITKKQAAYLAEHVSALEGVTLESRTVRDYPYGALAAHVLGYTGSASESELAEVSEGEHIESGDSVGKSGVELRYNNLLMGDHGQRVVVSDADGNIVQVKSEIQPTKGSDIRLTIKAPVQYLADKTLAETIAPNGIIGQGTGGAGSIVVLDVRDGSVVALSNYPTFKPSTFANGISQDTWNLYNTEASHYPLLNRAIAGTYPAASTFKAFSGTAGLEYGFTNQNTSFKCSGSWDGWNNGYVQRCWKRSGHGSLSFRQGIVDSCDIVFYEIAKKFFDNSASIGADAMQNVIMKFGFGSTTGIDLNGEENGRVPTKEWKAEYFKDIPTEASWLGGDETNTAIGQGYVLVTPLQLAVGYGGIATGKLMVPHVFKEVVDADGNVITSMSSQVLGVPEVSESNLQVIRDALHGVASENSSVSKYMGNMGFSTAAKTGTAEVSGKKDFGWTAGYAPYEDPKYVAVCIMEEGGGGSACATPVVAKMLQAAMQSDAGTVDKNIGVIAGSSGKSVAISSAGSGRTD